MTDASSNGPRVTGKGSGTQPLPKRFYKAVAIASIVPSPLVGEGQGGGDSRASEVGSPPAPNPSPQGGGGSVEQGGRAYRILLDGKLIRTPAKREVALPTRALAEAVAAEWAGQATHIDPATMPLTRLANSAIDGVAGREAEVRADIARYAGSDLVCYRAEGPAELVQQQSHAWDPLLSWACQSLGARFQVATGIMPVAQPDAAVTAIAAALAPFEAFGLAALHVMTTLTGSALLALGHARGHLTAEATWAAAHIDEDFQISQWGEDAEAKARRARRWAEMQAASLMLALSSPSPR